MRSGSQGPDPEIRFGHNGVLEPGLSSGPVDSTHPLPHSQPSSMWSEVVEMVLATTWGRRQLCLTQLIIPLCFPPPTSCTLPWKRQMVSLQGPLHSSHIAWDVGVASNGCPWMGCPLKAAPRWQLHQWRQEGFHPYLWHPLSSLVRQYTSSLAKRGEANKPLSPHFCHNPMGPFGPWCSWLGSLQVGTEEWRQMQPFFRSVFAGPNHPEL